jgi:hypothetical protein
MQLQQIKKKLTDNNISLLTVDWNSVPKTEHKGDTGTSNLQTIKLQGLRIRILNYSANYLANHWCIIDHIVYCPEGELMSKSQDSSAIHMKEGMTYVVSDELSSHYSPSKS